MWIVQETLNDRLTVTVGSNFELEGPQNSNQQSSNIAGNVALDYKLSEDGRYRLRGYRKNDYQGIIEGYIVETGLGFIITVDYNKFRKYSGKKELQKNGKSFGSKEEGSKRSARKNDDPEVPKNK